jgi:undecaprenyl-diphosphatase
MPLHFLLILAIVQGITEFLPISSSAHLVLLHRLGSPTGDELALDVAVHLGSIAAVILYTWPESRRALRGLGLVLRGRLENPDAFLAICLIIATIPAVILGTVIALMDWSPYLRSITVIGWMMILFGALLWWIDRRAPQDRVLTGWTLGHAVKMGLWQAVSLVPGVSRSGITITAARWFGYGRADAARLSMLMSIPITLATGALLARDAVKADAGSVLVANAAIAAGFAFVAAYLALVVMIRMIPKFSFTPWVIYRIALGVVLLGIAYG